MTDIFEESSWWDIFQCCFPIWKQLLELAFAQNLKSISSIVVFCQAKRWWRGAQLEIGRLEYVPAVVWMLMFYQNLYVEILISLVIIKRGGSFLKNWFSVEGKALTIWISVLSRIRSDVFLCVRIQWEQTAFEKAVSIQILQYTYKIVIWYICICIHIYQCKYVINCLNIYWKYVDEILTTIWKKQNILFFWKRTDVIQIMSTKCRSIWFQLLP